MALVEPVAVAAFERFDELQAIGPVTGHTIAWPVSRYIFACGDFYDGDFVRDKANGKGVYR